MELVIQNGLVNFLFSKTPLNRVNNWYSWMKSVAVENKFHRCVKFIHNKGSMYETNVKNLEYYFPLNHGCPDCVTITIVTDLNNAKTYLTCDGCNILSYIHLWWLRCGAVGWGITLWIVKVAGSIPDAVIRIFQRLNPTGSPRALNTFLWRLSGNYGKLNLF